MLGLHKQVVLAAAREEPVGNAFEMLYYPFLFASTFMSSINLHRQIISLICLKADDVTHLKHPTN